MEFLEGFTIPEVGGIGSAFKLLFLVIITGYVIYSILLTFRVRILSDTVKASSNKFVNLVVYIHLLLSIIGSMFCVILILLG